MEQCNNYRGFIRSIRGAINGQFSRGGWGRGRPVEPGRWGSGPGEWSFVGFFSILKLSGLTFKAHLNDFRQNMIILNETGLFTLNQ